MKTRRDPAEAQRAHRTELARGVTHLGGLVLFGGVGSCSAPRPGPQCAADNDGRGVWVQHHQDHKDADPDAPHKPQAGGQPGNEGKDSGHGERLLSVRRGPPLVSRTVGGSTYPVSRWYAGASPVYAIGTIAAAAFAAVLYKVVTGGAVTGALTDLVEQALSVKF